MDYAGTYEALINKARLEERDKGGEIYYESHHIVPRSMGGSDEPPNLVLLTAREHYVAHMLLYKAYPNNSSLVYAARMMCSRTNSRAYESLKESYSKAVSNALKGKKWSEERKAKMFTPDFIQKRTKALKENLKNNPRPPMSAETIDKLKDSLKESIWALPEEERKEKYARNGEANGRFGKPYEWSEEARAKVSASLKGVPKKKIECPHCGKQCAPNVANRWHFDNCKLKEENVSE